jgi:hypothetical protein
MKEQNKNNVKTLNPYNRTSPWIWLGEALGRERPTNLLESLPGEKPLPELMFASLIRAAESRRGLWSTQVTRFALSLSMSTILRSLNRVSTMAKMMCFRVLNIVFGIVILADSLTGLHSFIHPTM